MTDSVNSVYDFQQIEIHARQILGKRTFKDISVLWQEKGEKQLDSSGKHPFRLYIVNDGACLGSSPSIGSPVKCVKLCKRTVIHDYPKNTITGSKRSKITHRFGLILLVEYENSEFRVITLPRQLSALGAYRMDKTMAFSDIIESDTQASTPQSLDATSYGEKLTIISDDAHIPSAFEYRLTFPLDSFKPEISRSELENPSLQSMILLTNLRYDSEVIEPFLAPSGAGNRIWTTAVDFMLYEDIMIKLGMDQDIVVQGISDL